MTISPKKSWIGYPSAQVLGFRVDGVGLATTKERMAAFAQLKFPNNLAALESYIGAAGFLRHLIPYFAKLIDPLQRRKVQLLKAGREAGKVADNNKNKRKAYCRVTTFEPTTEEIMAFEAVQAEIASGRMLTHDDPNKRLYCQVDASLERGFAAVLFHTKDNYN